VTMVSRSSKCGCHLERRANAVGRRHDLAPGRPPPAGELDLEVRAGDAFDGLDHLAHGETAAIAELNVADPPPARRYLSASAVRARDSDT